VGWAAEEEKQTLVFSPPVLVMEYGVHMGIVHAGLCVHPADVTSVS